MGIFEDALKSEGVTGQLAEVARSIYHQESSGGTNTKTSNAGARGGMQIIPGTFKSVADKGWDINDPSHNARAGIRYLKQLDKQSGGVPELTAAGYYGGPGGMEKARRGIAVSDPRNPNAPNTLEYGRQVASRVGGYNGNTVAASQSQRNWPSNPVVAAEVATPVPSPVAQAQVPVQVQAQAQAPQAAGPDPWTDFVSKMNQPQAAQVGGGDMQYGMQQQQPYNTAINIPDFMSMVQQKPSNQANFAVMRGWGG